LPTPTLKPEYFSTTETDIEVGIEVTEKTENASRTGGKGEEEMGKEWKGRKMRAGSYIV